MLGNICHVHLLPESFFFFNPEKGMAAVAMIKVTPAKAASKERQKEQ